MSRLEPGTYLIYAQGVRGPEEEPVVLTMGVGAVNHGIPVSGRMLSLKQGDKQHFNVDSVTKSIPGVPPTDVPPFKYTIRHQQDGVGPKDPFVVAVNKGWIDNVRPQTFTITEYPARDESDEPAYKISVHNHSDYGSEVRFMELDKLRSQVFFAPENDKSTQLWKFGPIFLP